MKDKLGHVPSLAVVICTYNRSQSLLKTLQSLYSSGYNNSAPIDILVVANNCNDDTLKALKFFRESHSQKQLQLHWIEEPRPGKSHALNAAISHTDHDALCFIDDDQLVERGFLGHLLTAHKNHPDEDIYCGRIWPAWDGSEPSWVHTTDHYKIPIRPFPEFDMGAKSFVLSPDSRYPSGGNITVRRRVFQSTGIFSLKLGPTGHNLAGGEDHDLLKRATDKGFKIRYLPTVKQLHAIDNERMSTLYTLKKSFLRSRAHFTINHKNTGPRPYMLRKIFQHCAKSLFTFNSSRRFFYIIRLSASLGEFAGSVDSYRSRRNNFSQKLPVDKQSLLLNSLLFCTIFFGLFALVAGGGALLSNMIPAVEIAGLGTIALVIKSLSDFSQTGPKIKKEVLLHYRGYTFLAFTRLSGWAFGIMLFNASIGVFCYYTLTIVLDIDFSYLYAIFSAFLGVFIAVTLQFLKKLQKNPGLLVASMQYRMSRFYRIWHYITPRKLLIFESSLGILIGMLIAIATWKLAQDDQIRSLFILWFSALFFIGIITFAAWQPKTRIPTKQTTNNVDEQPNIIMIGSDTLRADRLGSMGYHRQLTPNIDKLSSKGTLFTNCYVPCARTASSLISILTGTWPHTHGVRDNFVADSEKKLKVDSLPILLKNSGYLTAAISDWCGADMGKYSFGFDYTDLPKDQWNLKYFIRQGPKDLRLFTSLFTHNRLGKLFLPEIYYLGGVPLTQPMGKHARQLVSRLARSNQPFFLNVFYSTTHPPFASEWPWYTLFSDPSYKGESKFAMARLTDPFDIIRRQGAPKEEFDLEQIIDLYDSCVAEFDHEVGKMLDHVDKCGLANNTIIVVYSDHGMEFFEHDTWGQGNSAIGEASPKIPLVIHDPRLMTKNKVDDIVRSIDLAPTLLDLTNIKQSSTMDGVSLASFLSNSEPYPDLDAFNETGIWLSDIPGLPDDHLRYPDLFELLEVPDLKSGTLAIKPKYKSAVLAAKDRMIRSGRWKLVYQPLESGHCLTLFDLVSDPKCQHDISDKHPKIVGQLKEKIQDWLNQ